MSKVVPDAEIIDLALDTAEEMTTKLSCFGVMMTKQSMWSNLEISSLAAAIELENRNQLLAGLHRQPRRSDRSVPREAPAGLKE